MAKKRGEDGLTERQRTVLPLVVSAASLRTGLEIAEVHRLPLSDLFAGRGRGGNRDLSAEDTSGSSVFSLFIPTLGHDMFAPTAAIMDHFREVALLGRPTPAVRFGEPRFARS